MFACSYPAVNAKYLSTWPLHLHPEYAEAITLIHKLKAAVTARAGQKKKKRNQTFQENLSWFCLSCYIYAKHLKLDKPTKSTTGHFEQSLSKS